MAHVHNQRSPPATRGGIFLLGHARHPTANQRNLRQHSEKAPLCFQQTTHSFAAPKTPTYFFSFASTLFEVRGKFNRNVSSNFRTLCALFCMCSSANSFVLNRLRTLCKNHPGGGGGLNSKNLSPRKRLDAGSPSCGNPRPHLRQSHPYQPKRPLPAAPRITK
jgi:hypothetical protein